MSVMSGRDIIRARDRGQVVIEPFNEEYVNGASVDVTLGPDFFRVNDERGHLYNPFDPAAVSRHFRPGIPTKDYHLGDVIVINGGERILAHTNEFIGMVRGGTTQMAARSTWGRNGISVCLCAGWGDPGFINRWTMEIQNHNKQPVPLPVGERIAQIVFHRMEDEAVNGYGADPDKYKYQTGTNLKEVMENWRPHMMLPKSSQDR